MRFFASGVLICCAFLCLTLPSAISAERIIQVAQGRIRGVVEDVKGHPVESYLGVPFASPPVGQLRFRPPRRLSKWRGTMNTTKLAPACMQNPDNSRPGFWGAEMWNPNTEMSEDCLYLNIWTPKTKGGHLLPVMVYIFGGGFVSGSPSLLIYDGKAMARFGNVVVVNINYRVSFFGFGYLGHPDMPGNVGLLDQQVALQWVHDNIEAFGGDNKQVAIFGESAGSASVSAHTLAPQSRNLFKSAIMQSASILCPWALQSQARMKEKTLKLAEALGCSKGKSEAKMIACLRQAPARQITKETASLQILKFMEFDFVPVENDGAFFPSSVSELLRTVDHSAHNHLLGFMADEGAFFMAYFLTDQFSPDRPWKINLKQFLKASETALASSPVSCSKQAESRYASTALYHTYANAADELVGDMEFVCCLLDFGLEAAKTAGSTYLYHFNYTISTDPWPKKMGALHGYEIELVFGQPLVNSSYTREEVEFAKRLIGYWTNMAKIGRPTKNADIWPAVKLNAPAPIRVLQPNGEHLSYDMKKTECNFWKKVEDSKTCILKQ